MGTQSRGPGDARLVFVEHEPDGRQTEIPAFRGDDLGGGGKSGPAKAPRSTRRPRFDQPIVKPLYLQKSKLLSSSR